MYIQETALMNFILKKNNKKQNNILSNNQFTGK